MTTNPFPVPQSNRNLTILAWVTTVLISTVPDILMDKLAGGIPAWLAEVKMGLLLALILSSFIWKTLRPLFNYLLVMFAFFTLFELLPLVNFTFPALQDLFGNTVFDVRMQAEQTGKVAVSVVMILILLWLGFKRRFIFLWRGDMRAPIDPVSVLGFPKPEPWSKFGLLWGFAIAGTLAVVFTLGAKPGSASLLKVLPVLPSILFYAALNSFNEEITYRVPMLATLEPVGGSLHALWLSAFFFGIAHYFGTPGGILGGILSIFMGWILGKAMLETRGLFWSWWIHFLSDIVIFFFLTLALV